MSRTRSECGVVDMEAYALAKVCWLEGARFACVKYVTDGADHAAAGHWRDNVHKAAEEFLALYRAVERDASAPPSSRRGAAASPRPTRAGNRSRTGTSARSRATG